VRAVCGVHGGGGIAAKQARITLIAARLGARRRFPCVPVANSR
jgi:hypothetical protein